MRVIHARKADVIFVCALIAVLIAVLFTAPLVGLAADDQATTTDTTEATTTEATTTEIVSAPATTTTIRSDDRGGSNREERVQRNDRKEPKPVQATSTPVVQKNEDDDVRQDRLSRFSDFFLKLRNQMTDNDEDDRVDRGDDEDEDKDDTATSTGVAGKTDTTDNDDNGSTASLRAALGLRSTASVMDTLSKFFPSESYGEKNFDFGTTVTLSVFSFMSIAAGGVLVSGRLITV